MDLWCVCSIFHRMWIRYTGIEDYLTFICPCIVIYSHSTTNKTHLLSQIIYFCKKLYMFRMVFPSIIRSSKPCIQQWYMSNSCCYLLLTRMRCSMQVAETVWHTPLLYAQSERRLRVFENRVLRKVFGPKRDEVTGEWGKLHNKELNDLYSLPNIVRVVKSRRMRWAGHVARMGEDRGVQRVLVGKPKGKRPLGRPRRRWEDNTEMDLQEVGGGSWGLDGGGSG